MDEQRLAEEIAVAMLSLSSEPPPGLSLSEFAYPLAEDYCQRMYHPNDPLKATACGNRLTGKQEKYCSKNCARKAAIQRKALKRQ